MPNSWQEWACLGIRQDGTYATMFCFLLFIFMQLFFLSFSISYQLYKFLNKNKDDTNKQK